MIITVTANPSIDRALRLDSALLRGEVQPVHPGADEAGGKGANVAKALVAAGIETAALVLAEAVLEKFGGDSVAETRRNCEAYLADVASRGLEIG